MLQYQGCFIGQTIGFFSSHKILAVIFLIFYNIQQAIVEYPATLAESSIKNLFKLHKNNSLCR